MQEQDKAALKAAILSAVSEESDQWLAVESELKTGYEYEDRFSVHARRITNTILQKSMGKVPSGKNHKKNSIPVQA
jgi:hypothetical protein